MSDRRPFKHGVTVTLPTDPTDREAILNLWREQGIHVSGGQEGDGIANTDPEALLKPRRYRMNSLHDKLAEALSIEDDHPTRMEIGRAPGREREPTFVVNGRVNTRV